MTSIRLLKGHGTGNDFVIVPDHDGALNLSEAQVRLLCDRHRGIGGDGVLRVVRVGADAEARALAALDPGAAEAQWFMDYRNADGSIAEMCGNGIRVFAQYLASAGLVGGQFDVLTRGGTRALLAAGPAGEWIVAMGQASRLPFIPAVTAHGGATASALSVLEIPNPHVVIKVVDEAALEALDLTVAPSVRPPLPHGQNVEFVAITGPRALTMRVHERGVGETLSCGTGICAAAIAASDHAPKVSPSTWPSVSSPSSDPELWTVTVPGGVCTVELRSDGEVLLHGPAVLVAELTVSSEWLGAA
ncbi:MAG: diaminopimelate epimerase [Jatrophihabitantaceae bacterium]|nr:diaminopimelate epimerase [Jatrophihabitantaceae bacterium]